MGKMPALLMPQGNYEGILTHKERDLKYQGQANLKHHLSAALPEEETS